MDIVMRSTEGVVKWQRRTILYAFGLLGFGAAAAAGIMHILNKIENNFQIQSKTIKNLQIEVHDLKTEVALLKNSITSYSSHHEKKKSSDDDEYLTADEEEEVEEKLDPTHRENEESIQALDEPEFFLQIDKLLDGTTEQQHEACKLLNDNTDKFQYSSDFWWRIAKASHSEGTIAESTGNKESKREHFDNAYIQAKRSVELNDTSACAHKWLAITCGARTDFLGINEKIQNGYKFKEHVDRAISLDPMDSTCYYLLGRFCLEVSMLSWIERRVASTLFSAPPTSTPKEALEYFKTCENLKPFMDNRYHMGKCYNVLGNKIEALHWLDLAAEMPVTTATDKVCLAQVIELQNKLRY